MILFFFVGGGGEKLAIGMVVIVQTLLSYRLIYSIVHAQTQTSVTAIGQVVKRPIKYIAN